MSASYGYAADDAVCETGARGEKLEVKLFGRDLLVTWHTDHAVKQVRIVALELL